MSIFSKFFSATTRFCFAAVVAASSTPVSADANLDVAARGLTLSNASGRTLVGVTRDSSKIWSVYLSRNGQAKFNFSTGRKATARWYRDSRDILCFKGLIKDSPNKPICKLTTPRGRGMDWMTVELYEKDGKRLYRKATKSERRGSSQIVYSFAGERSVDKNSYISNLRYWAGNIVVGRTLKDREAWAAHFKRDGKFDFTFGSGKRYTGRYTATSTQICLTFPSRRELNGCRKPTRKDGKVYWASSKDGSYISEVVFITKAAKKPAVVAKKTPPKPKYAIQAKSYSGGFLKFPKGNLPNGKIFVHYDLIGSNIHFVDTARGKTLATLKRKNAISSVHMLGSLISWVEADNSFHIWNTSNSNTLDIQSIPMQDFDLSTAVTNTNGTLAALKAKESTDVRLWDVEANTLRDIISFDDADKIRPLGFVRYSNLMTTLLDRDRIRTTDIETGDYFDIRMEPTMTFRDFEMSKNGSLAVLTQGNKDSNSGYISTYKRNGSAWDLVKRVRSFKGQPGQVSISHQNSELLVSTFSKSSKDRAIHSYVLPSLTSKKTIKPRTYGSLAHFGTTGAYWFKPGLSKEQHLMARSQYAANTFKSSTGGNSFALSDAINAETRRVKGELNRERARYKVLLQTANDHYAAGRCSDYDAMFDDLKKKDRKEKDCRKAKVANAKTLEFETAVMDLKCEDAERLHVVYEVGTRSTVDRCFNRVQKRNDLLAFARAKQDLDCATLARLETKLRKQGASLDCQTEKALQSDSPRKMFLAAVKLDTAGEFSRAKIVYEAVMDRFPEDDIALNAATRLVTLTDQIRDTEKANQLAAVQEQETQAQLLAAKREAEAARKRAAEAEKAAKRDKEKRDREARTQRRKNERLANIKRKLADLNSKYDLHNNYARVSSKVSGRERYYDISGYFRIKPVVQTPTTAREFCKVKIESATYPRHSKINLPNNRYFNPKRGSSAFIVDLGANPPSDSRGTWQGKHLFKPMPDNKVDFSQINNGKQVRIRWNISINKLSQSDLHYKSNSRTTVIQVFRSPDPLFEELSSLIKDCYLARAD